MTLPYSPVAVRQAIVEQLLETNPNPNPNPNLNPSPNPNPNPNPSPDPDPNQGDHGAAA